MTLLMLSTEHSSGQKSFFFWGGGWAAVKMEGMEYYVYSGTSNGGTLCHILKTFRRSLFGGYTIAFSWKKTKNE